MAFYRFATYYENNPESRDISKVLKKNTEIKSKIRSVNPSKETTDTEKKHQADERAYLKQSVEMKIAVALMYIDRSNSTIASI